MWDDEVAVISVGAGPGGLAYAVATADAGLDVLIAAPPPDPGGRDLDADRGRLTLGTDRLTDEYLAELTAGAIMPGTSGGPEMPARTVYPTPEQRSRKVVVDTFLGARLLDWAGRCLVSPFGAVLTTVDHWPAVRRTPDGLPVGVAPLGAANGSSVSDWMADAVRERDITVLDDATLQHLVFDEGRVIGAVFDTPEGDYAVQARYGLALTPVGGDPVSAAPIPAGGDFALVGLPGCRFVRLELVHTEVASD